MKRPCVTAITGGIGAGKSVVCNILRVMGYEVYDCDIEAKRLMDRSAEIKQRIADEIASETIAEDGCIDRTRLSSIVFNDRQKLETLNTIVHGAVINHMLQWRDSHAADRRLFVETAILYQSGLDRHVDEVWDVIAPDQVRISRVMQRNNLSREEVERRIASQKVEVGQPHPDIHTIVNDGFTPILPQIILLNKSLSHKKC